MIYTAKKIAEYILQRQDPEDFDVSNLKLQKLLYYCQGFFLARYDEPLFNEDIQAWTHGPVVKEVYAEFNKFKKSPIKFKRKKNFELPDLSQEKKDFLNEVIDSYGQYSAWRLRDLTHEELPWIRTFNTGKNLTISHELMNSFFKTQLR